MKFTLAAVALVGSAAAFSPAFSTRSSGLKMTATGSETYTFTKSEEIFAEAQTVSALLAANMFVSGCPGA